jgi:hypothetical protein
MTGQINMNTAFGREIARIASDPRYLTFCEVGTWNGDGSTRCIYEGIKHHPDARLYSIEGDPLMMAKAEAIWKGNSHVTLLMGTLHRNIMTENEVETHPRFHTVRDHYRLHYTTERRTANLTPIVKPPPCDVILLDGGEFSTEGDWNALYHRNLRVVMLDDTQVIKTNRIMIELLTDPGWKCLRNEPNDRNGWAIFERVEVSE